MRNDTVNGTIYQGFYKGRVVKHLSHGKCKILIPEVYNIDSINTDSEADKLPDALPAAPIFGGGNNGNGCFSYPDIGSIVWCFFDNGDINFPVYFASCLGGEEAKMKYSDCKLFANDKVLNQIDKNDAPVHIINSGRVMIIISESGAVKIVAADSSDKTKAIFSKIELNANGNMNISCTGQLTLTSENLKIVSKTGTEIDSPAFKVNSNVKFQTSSPSIKLDSGTYGTVFAVSAASTKFGLSGKLI
jgi:hypothetical protein